MSSSSKHLLVAAIDFGTTYSGYAFSFRNDPLDIKTNAVWNAGTEKLISLKTPTCVLATANREFHSFGFEAENKYIALTEDNNHHGMLFFRRFKMLLHNNENLSRTTTVEDINGVSMPAKTIFVWSIRYLRNHLLNALNKQVMDVEESDIMYVLTVPAIWNDNAKQFMREAALEAGIEDANLKLALEPEAASVWCQIVTTDVKAHLSKAGTQYMVVDLGGGTADISVHERQIDNTLKQLHRASGGPWGGNAVDNNFIEWLTRLFGKQTMERFKTEQMEDYFGLLRDFETKKRIIKTDTTDKITFRVSASLKEIFQKINTMSLDEKVAALKLTGRVSFPSDKLRVDASVIKELFATPVNNVISHVKKILEDPRMQNVETVLLVGGFGESELVQDEMKKHIKKQRLIIPTDAGLVVLKGAVRFGHLPEIVSSRVMSYTYGVAVMEEYDENIHNKTQIAIINNRKMANNIFCIFVRLDEEVKVAQPIHRPNYTPTGFESTGLRVYKSTQRDPRYTTDEGCCQLGTLSIDHPEGDTLQDKKFDVTFIFGDTELLVKAKINSSGRAFSKYVDCLN